MLRTNSTLAAIIVVTCTTTSFADTWSFPPKIDEKVYAFGDVRIVRTIDSRRNTRYPEFSISIYRNDELRALYRGVSFEHLAASKENELFVGVSNSGLPGTALVIFDAKGNLRYEIKHNANFPYCQQSITLVREWYDKNNPDIRFNYFEKRELGHRIGEIKSISIKDCHGIERGLSDLIDQVMGLKK